MNEYVHCTGVYIFQGDFMISGRGGELKMVHQKAIFFILLGTFNQNFIYFPLKITRFLQFNGYSSIYCCIIKSITLIKN